MTKFSITHRLPLVTSGACPDCGEVIRTSHSIITAAVNTVPCHILSEAERLRLQLEQAEDKVLNLRRQLERLERLNA